MANNIYGYARISTPKQDINRQIRNIKDLYDSAYIISEAYTGTKIERPEFTKLIKKIKAGDTIVFDEVSRMARNASEGFDLYKRLYEQGVKLIFIKEPHLNTDVYRESLKNGLSATGNVIADIYIEATNKVLMILAEKQIITAFEKAQQEVDYLHKRTSEGLLTAKLNGKRVGRQNGETVETKKAKAAKEIIKKHSKTFGGSLADSEVQRLAGISRNSYYKYKAELKAI